MRTPTSIHVEDGEWTCLCGNTAATNGFYPYESGMEVEPTPEEWTSGLYFCVDCLALINGNGEIKGQANRVLLLDGFYIVPDLH